MRLTRSLLLGLVLVCAAHAADTLRVMTFNVRYPAQSDGPNLWEKRRDLLVSTIRENHPDLMGTQELFQLQGDYIVEKLPEYAWFGLSRRGNHEDEHMGVFYRKDRLELAVSGNFWLSETPEQPGSMSWNINLPRLVTWGDFKDKTTGRTFRFYNTHFPHRGNDEDARTECARVIAERLRALAPETTVILTGDFNTDIASKANAVLTEVLKDAFRAIENPAGPKGTFHGFKGSPGAARIDWILYRGAVEPESMVTITANEDGRYPSDHFPVLAVFEWK